MSVFELEERCTRLREKLKEWETSFAAAHEGRKPLREDVKREPNIGKLYYQCTNQLEGSRWS